MTCVGVLGVGHLIKHLMPALMKTGRRFVLSQRNAAISADLQKRFGVEIRENTQSIVDEADIVIVAVRPFQVAALCDGLRFRDGQILLSLCAGIHLTDLAILAHPAIAVRAMPVIAGEFGESPTLLCPDNEKCRDLLAPCGPILVLRDEAEFEPASVAACYFGWVQNLIGTMAEWTSENGVSPETSRLLIAQMTRAAGTLVRERTETSVDDLVTEITPPRSLTGLGLDHLKDENAFLPWRQAGDRVLSSIVKKQD